MQLSRLSKAPSGAPLRALRGPETLLLALSATLFLGSCVSRPSLDEWSELGFRTPKQTLRTFQLAVRADSARVEYQCLSVHMRRGLSQLAWREAREDWYRENPFLRTGIAKAEIESSDEISDGYWRIVIASYGRRFEIAFVREDFYQVYAEGRLVADDLLDYSVYPRFSDHLSVSEPEDGVRVVSGAAEVDARDIQDQITEFRIGREWKVDGFRPLDDPGPSNETTEPTQ